MKKFLLAAVLMAACTAQLSAQQNTRGGAVVGGATGAIIGGIIGHQNDETPEGAIIGGVVGAVTGGLIGKAKDQQIQRERPFLHRGSSRSHRVLQRCDVAFALSRASVRSLVESSRFWRWPKTVILTCWLWALALVVR